MTPRVLVAGVGNVFFGDDGFGVEVVRRLSAEAPLPAGAHLVDFGIRGLHLALALLEPLDALVVIDLAPRGAPPGTIVLLEPIADEAHVATTPDAHGMILPAVFASVRAMGGALPRVLIVGCEPAEVDEGIGLSPEVQRAIGPAIELIREVVDRELERATTHTPREEVTRC